MYKNNRFEISSHSLGREHGFQTRTVQRIIKGRGSRFLRSDKGQTEVGP